MAEFGVSEWLVALAIFLVGAAAIWHADRFLVGAATMWHADRVQEKGFDRPILLGDILGRLDIDVDAVPKRILSLEFRKITWNCAECWHTAECRRWLFSGEGSKDAYRGFCPNAKIFDRLR